VTFTQVTLSVLGRTDRAVPDTYTDMGQRDADGRRRFDDLFAAFGSDVVAYCRWQSESPSDAQDAASEVFLTAWRRLDDVPAGDAARIWLYATARRVLANQRRSNRRRIALQDRLIVEAAASPDVAAPDQERELVHEALRRLGRRDREVLLLAEWEGLSPAEIGHVLGCLTVTARGRLHRARRRFRAAFEELSSVSAPQSARPLRRELRVREGGS
jgi:RNA polymerase sigma-70 factor, ECF subfamily